MPKKQLSSSQVTGGGAVTQKTKIFISYSREDYNAAQRLYKELSKSGINPWLDKQSLLPGQNWQNEIRKAITDSNYFIPLFSSNAVKNRGFWRREELEFASKVLAEIPKSEIYVIPVRLDECEIPLKKFREYHYVDLFPNWREGLKKLLQSSEISKYPSFQAKKRLPKKKINRGSKNFIRQHLPNANFFDTNLRRADFSDAYLKGADFSYCKLQEAKFLRANLQNADFLEAELQRANLSDADLRRADFSYANLKGADLTNAKRTGADFGEAIFT
ncbi:MAG TPA: TIR domain-containing protein [Nitrososphaeraceae archaeon]|nr:TIR domain-containing protein [Nitrososphaeraceae archaeon]